MKLGYFFDSSIGFKLTNRAIRSLNASFVMKDRWEALTEKQKHSYPPLCPDFVAKLNSTSGDLEELKDKMQEYMHTGCRLGLRMDIKNEKLYI